MNSSIDAQLAKTANTAELAGKADVSDPGLLQTALLMCKLSQSVYDRDATVNREGEVLQQHFCRVTNQIASFKPKLEYSHHADDSVGPFQDSGRQYAIWSVERLGMVVTFGGTQDGLGSKRPWMFWLI